MRQRDDEPDGQVNGHMNGEVRLNAPGAGSGLMFRQGLELVTAVATRLRQLPGPHCAWETEPPHAHRMLLTLAMELNSALQLLRSAEEGHLPASIARREAANLLQRFKTMQANGEAEEQGPAHMLPPLLQLPAHQLASIQAALVPHLTLLAESAIADEAKPHRPTSALSPKRGVRTAPALHLVPRAE